MTYLKWFPFICLVALLACQEDPVASEKVIEKSTVKKMTTLPMKEVTLIDLSPFNTTGKNWIIGGGVYADLDVEKALEVTNGQGMLINQQTDTENSHLLTKWEHGDIDLELDVLVPKGSNSGIYLQGRYEIQIFDSWGKDEVAHSDCGGIYQRWDDTKPEGQQGYEGTAPNVNAAKLPGLWQHFRIEFQAPRFDSSGVKIQNALFKKVLLNGFLIHENVEVTGPTRAATFTDEVAIGPLFIQGDHGPVAFKNIRYKAYTFDQLSLTDLSYEYFEGKDNKLPDFSKLTPSKTGKVDSIDVKKVSDKNDGYRLIYKGTLNVPVDGEYLFTTRIDDGGELFIDGQLVVQNAGDIGLSFASELVTLTKGTHDFMHTYYQEVWGAELVIYYEGPGMIKQTLASQKTTYSWDKKPKPVLVNNLEQAEMIRAFVNHDGKKKTNILSVGHPQGVHYSYDLRTPNLIKTWKGEFADVTKMWQGRGGQQLLEPMNIAVDLTGGVPIAALNSETSAWPSFVTEDFKFKGYEVDNENQPTFKFNYRNTPYKDQILPYNDGNSLVRTVTKMEDGPMVYLRVAAADQIKR
ncbi:MAG: family 16 glycoside hydrolase, partial [Bacteroidota bacterium]